MPTMVSQCMSLSEHTFRHVALSTATLDSLVNMKNNLYEDDDDVPLTTGVYAADIHPEISSGDFKFQMNWIVNTDTSQKPGTHWQCVLYKQNIISGSNAEEEPCFATNYYIIDSWGVKHVKNVAKDMLGNITIEYNCSGE